jgi:hypothetical protein
MLVSFAAAGANELGLPLGSPSRDALVRCCAAGELHDLLGRDQGWTVSSTAFERLVVFAAGGSRR